MDELGVTTHAAQATELAELFTAAVEDLVVKGDADRKVRLLAPGVQSTQGGELSRQHIVLEGPESGMPSIAVGWIDVGSGLARIKAHHALVEILAARFPSDPPSVDAESYAAFVTAAKQILASKQIAVSIDTLPSIPPPPGAAPVPTPPGGSIVPLVVLAVLAGLGVAAYLMMR